MQAPLLVAARDVGVPIIIALKLVGLGYDVEVPGGCVQRSVILYGVGVHAVQHMLRPRVAACM